MNYQAALDYVWGLVNFETKPPAQREPYTLDRMRALLDAVGNPQNRVPAVHVTGSKGKGSTAAMIESVLRAAGYRTGLYTSPHLHSPRERIRVAGHLMPRDAFIALVERLRSVANDLHDVTTFEFLTAMCFCYFVEKDVEVAVVEVGLGGTLDATNLIEQPLVSVITPISLEHTQVLGDTVAEIAADKAGIIKSGVPAVAAPQPEDAGTVLERAAANRRADLFRSDRMWRWERHELSLDGQTFTLVADAPDVASHEALFVPLLGRHQLSNATTAVTALHVMQKVYGIAWSEDALRRGLAQVEWPARMEVLDRAPLVLADGAHNGASAQVLRDALDELVAEGIVAWDRCWLLLAVLGDKDVSAIVTPLVPLVDGIVVSQTHHPRARPAADLAEQVGAAVDESASVPIEIRASVADAVATALERVGTTGALLATGSLVTAAEVRAAFGLGWQS